jgi:nucleotide-binding universal stress UspA family protein
MKPILIATDYSPAALHAADYAAQLALATHTPLILFHSWSLPALDGGVVVGAFPVADFEKTAQEAIENEANRIEKKWGIKVTSIQSVGFAVEEIENCCRACDVGLVVMGMRQTDSIERAFGSVVTAFIKRDAFPLLVIPEKVKFKLPEKILLAADLNKKSEWKELDLLKELSTAFYSGIHILNVVPQELHAVVTMGNETGHKLETTLKKYPHSWHYEEAGDIVDGIYKTANEITAQWIAVVHRHLNWLQRIFNRSTTRQLAFATNIPLLILPEK